jgi:Holliday junction resolvase RusA-like endonuclease
MKVEFTVPGVVVGKQRPKFSRQGPYVRTFTPQKTVNYETLVKMEYFRQCKSKKLSGAIRAEMRFYFPIPKSESKKKQAAMLSGEIRHTKKSDIDNCIKSVLDGLNKMAFDDDGQIAEIHAYKYYSEEPRAEITLEEIYQEA